MPYQPPPSVRVIEAALSFLDSRVGGVIGGNNNDVAWANAMTLLQVAGGGTLHVPAGTYGVSNPCNLPSTTAVTVEGPGAIFQAKVAMTSVIAKPSGWASFMTLRGLTIDANGLADRCLDIEQANRLQLDQLLCLNALVTVVELGRLGGQVYESSVRSCRLWGLDPVFDANPAHRPAYGLKTGANCTDNTFADVVVKNVSAAGFYEGGANNEYTSNCHVFGIPYTVAGGGSWEPSYGWDIHGVDCHLIGVYSDTVSVAGVNAAADRLVVIGSRFYWPGDYPLLGQANTPEAIIAQSGTVAHTFGFNSIVNLASPAQTFKYLGSKSASVFGNKVIGGASTPNEYSPNVWQIARGNTGEVLVQWFGNNPGRLVASGSGATGFVKLIQDTAGGGVMLSDTGGKLAFLGTTPIAKQSLTYSRATETAADAQLRGVLVGLGLVTDSTTA